MIVDLLIILIKFSYQSIENLPFIRMNNDSVCKNQNKN